MCYWLVSLISRIIERITYQACLDDTIIDQGGVQENLNQLATLELFEEIMKEVVASKRLVLGDVRACVKCLYEEVFKYADENTGQITIREKDFTANKYAALITFFKLQDKWSYSLVWREEKMEVEGLET